MAYFFGWLIKQQFHFDYWFWTLEFTALCCLLWYPCTWFAYALSNRVFNLKISLLAFMCEGIACLFCMALGVRIVFGFFP